MNEPILEIDEDGTKRWFLNGFLHREDGPAIEWVDGDKEWWQNGELHRIDGPAIEWINKYKEWLIDGDWYPNQEEWFQQLTPEQQYNYLWNIDE